MNKLTSSWEWLKVKGLPLLYIFILLGGLLVTLYLVQNRLIFRSKATLGSGRIDLINNISTNPDSSFDVPILINTGGGEILGADIVVSYDRTYLDISEVIPAIQNNPLNRFLPTTNTNVLDTPLVLQNARNTGKIEFSAIAYNASKSPPGLNGVLTPLATLRFKALREGSTAINVAFVTDSKNDSNLINKSAVDVLGQATNTTVNIIPPDPEPSATPTGDTDIKTDIIATIDDGYSINNWGHNETDSRISVGSNYDAGFRFPLNIPANSQIVKATLTANLHFSYGGAPASVNLKAEKTLDSLPLSGNDTATFIPNRTYLTASIPWSIAGFDTEITSPDVTSLIQGVVNQPGWVAGKNVLISLLRNSSNYARLISREGDPNRAAKLSVTYRKSVVRESKTLAVLDDGYAINNWGHNETAKWILAGGNYDAGFRFALPAKGKIVSAKLILPLKFVNGATTVNVQMKAEQALRATPISGDNPFISNRIYFPTYVKWSIAGFDTEITSPDIANLIQDIVNQQGWIPNREILIALIKTDAGNRPTTDIFPYAQFNSKDLDPTKAKLVVEYEYVE